MKPSEIQFLYRYNEWATGKILNAAAGLAPGEFEQARTLTWGSLRGTMVHAYGAEWIWRRRCQERVSPPALPSEQDFPDFATLRDQWLQEQGQMRDYVVSLSEDELRADLTYRTTSGRELSAPLWQVLLHVVNHGTQHRAEVAHVLSELGLSPGDVDLIVYVRELQSAST